MRLVERRNLGIIWLRMKAGFGVLGGVVGSVLGGGEVGCCSLLRVGSCCMRLSLIGIVSLRYVTLSFMLDIVLIED
jgi:hypothetical protein